MNSIKIQFNQHSFIAEVYDTLSGKAIIDNLPIESSVNTWGEEIYFSIPVNLELEDDARVEAQIGELGYWPSGKAFCIFFGVTPASHGNEPRAVSPVNIFGKIDGNIEALKEISPSETVRVTLK